MPNSGPPYYATDAVEASRAQAHQVSAARRRAFQVQMQARLKGNSARLKTLTENWMPIIQRRKDVR